MLVGTTPDAACGRPLKFYGLCVILGIMTNAHNWPQCIATAVDLTGQTDSEAHIIPNAIGGRLKPRGILSRSANSMIGQYIEAPFFEKYQPILSFIGGKRQRGVHPSFGVEDLDGTKYTYDPSGNLYPSKPEYNIESNGKEDRIQITARTKEELRTMLGRVEKSNPNFNIEDAIKNAVVVHDPSPVVKVSLSVGPNVYFPISYIIANLFNAFIKIPLHKEFSSYFSTIGSQLNLMPPDTFYWEPRGSMFDSVNAATHLVAAISSVRKKKTLTVVRLIGLPGVAVVSDYDREHSAVMTYSVDVNLGQNVEINLEFDALQSADWGKTHDLGDRNLQLLHEHRISNVLKLAQKLGYIQ